MVTVLFICVQNAGRSQMAEAIFNKLSDGKHKGISAGSEPADRVNPIVAKALQEIGIDISNEVPKKLSVEMVEVADLAITMGCGKGVCPIVPNEMRDWPLEDPKGKTLEEVRRIRDEIYRKVSGLIAELDTKRHTQINK